ncbi:hypothetical protein [Paraburkholderia acidicola]|uniref:hypothetical protein n=1 Tax=Paraburkholderia acidicola TaxID=1912599 RepID=UPI0014747C86|nr:hypothetical protein [Paraburkholderia acidicola]
MKENTPQKLADMMPVAARERSNFCGYRSMKSAFDAPHILYIVTGSFVNRMLIDARFFHPTSSLANCHSGSARHRRTGERAMPT